MKSVRFLHLVVLLVMSLALGCGNKTSTPSSSDNPAAARAALRVLAVLPEPPRHKQLLSRW